jgi:tRNA pseudouridine55 synthase
MQGILVVNKPKGMTSFAVVNAIHKLTKTKAGHAGTLDPMAEGILIIMLGSATKRAQEFEAGEKEYVTEITFGSETDSLDSTGKVLSTKPFDLTEAQLKDVLNTFMGETQQIPPMVSALKKNGVRLYEMARAGITIEREPRKITISEIELISFSGDKAEFRVVCSKGTYIRSICADIGVKLNTVAHMSKLTRTRSGKFKLSDAKSLEEIFKLHNLGELDKLVCQG